MLNQKLSGIIVCVISMPSEKFWYVSITDKLGEKTVRVPNDFVQHERSKNGKLNVNFVLSQILVRMLAITNHSITV